MMLKHVPMFLDVEKRYSDDNDLKNAWSEDKNTSFYRSGICDLERWWIKYVD